MKNRILGGYEPAAVLAFFEDICAIPHVSGDERAVADYIAGMTDHYAITVYSNIYIPKAWSI